MGEGEIASGVRKLAMTKEGSGEIASGVRKLAMTKEGSGEIASGMKKLAMTGVNWDSHAPITGKGISELRMVKGYNDVI
jgi:hypothetical protein